MDVIQGDLFSHDGMFIGHGCNTRGVMGAGIAKAFSANWPEMYQVYKLRCEKGELPPGDIFPYHDPSSKVTVYNLMTQDDPGPNARLEWVERAVGRALHDISERYHGLLADEQFFFDKALALPWVGCGIGGLNRNDVADVLERLEALYDVRIVIYEVD